MKLTVDKKEFLTLLQKGGVYAGKAKTVAILDCVKITIKDNSLRIISNDNENIIKVIGEYIDCDTLDFSFCVNAKDITNYVKLCPDNVIEIEVSEMKCTIKHSKGDNTYPIFDADEFPVIELEKDIKYMEVDSRILYDAIYNARNFVGTDDLRPVMKGIYFMLNGTKIEICSSNTTMLYTDSYVTDCQYEETEFILNPKSFNPILSMATENDKIYIAKNKGLTLFKTANTTIVARMMEGKFPNFHSVIPKTTPIEVLCSKKEFKSALDRVIVAANQINNLIKLSIDSKMLKINVEDVDYNKEGNEKITCSSNMPIEIGVRYEMLKTCLSSIDTDNARIFMIDPTKPIILKDNEENNKIILLMPIYL